MVSSKGYNSLRHTKRWAHNQESIPEPPPKLATSSAPAHCGRQRNNNNNKKMKTMNKLFVPTSIDYTSFLNLYYSRLSEIVSFSNVCFVSFWQLNI